MYRRFIAIIIFFGVSFSLLYMRIYYLVNDNSISEVASNQGSYTVTINKTYANIYDCNLKPLVNENEKYLAVINPTPQGVIDVNSYIVDKELFYKNIENGKPFVCEVTTDDIKSEDVITFAVKERTSSSQLAQHIVGYTVDNKGVSGIEKAYDDFLRSNYSTNKISYSVDANGSLLSSSNRNIDLQQEMTAGVITTIDKDIQKICEEAATNIEMGAIIVMDPYTGELKAVVSAPSYDINNLGSSIQDSRSPFINRAFSPYNVGSIFKLVTASAALEEGIDENLEYNCTGHIDIYGQNFNCHKKDGHGPLTMKSAMVESCNTYYINLGMKLNNTNFINKASILGFGKQTILADGIISDAGNLQTENDLKNPAEKANMSFGQGKLSATPLQIACMTSSIVNNGKFTNAKLIKGITDGKETTMYEDSISYQAMDASTAYTLRQFMDATVQYNDDSTAKPYNTSAAGKTSTAQTGKYNKDGEEILQAWFTGYFPIDKPKYVVTVLIEDGKSGNVTAAPVFKEIAEKITKLNY